ncbi:MAG: MotA/TolQ/ExbB proton channel family protein [Planctomycetota bacterium]|nr:MotA/TolQ/ExbB proton channel family protein [Planctomycetota bacterium]
MKLRYWGILLAWGLVLGAASSAFGSEVSGKSLTVFEMFWKGTFHNFFGLLDHIVIWSCSMLSIGLMIEHSLTIRKTTLVPDVSVAQIQTMFEERRFREALEFCQSDPSFVASIVHAGLVEAGNGYEAMERAMEDATNERTSRLYRKIEWLNMIGNVTPMCGLTGTVWGMMTAFGEIAAKGGKANPADLAGGILIALTSTFSGLMTAVPALVAYGIFRGKVEQLSLEGALVAEELLANFRPAPASA